jgi:hypothetical protein
MQYLIKMLIFLSLVACSKPPEPPLVIEVVETINELAISGYMSWSTYYPETHKCLIRLHGQNDPSAKIHAVELGTTECHELAKR